MMAIGRRRRGYRRWSLERKPGSHRIGHHAHERQLSGNGLRFDACRPERPGNPATGGLARVVLRLVAAWRAAWVTNRSGHQSLSHRLQRWRCIG